MSFVVVTGTGTGVGKTIATAALVCAAASDGLLVSVVKPCQTGVMSAEPSDIATVAALSGCRSVHELVRLDDPLAPDSAARLRGIAVPPMARLAQDVAACGAGSDVTFVEGAGGVAVRLDTEGGTIVTLAGALREAGHAVDVVVVTSLTLGTLNHTELSVAHLRSAGFEPAGLVLGDLPTLPGLAERCNIEDLPRVTGLPVIAAIPSGAGAWAPDAFAAAAPTWVVTTPRLW
jgi:dethiobiotin synthetase